MPGMPRKVRNGEVAPRAGAWIEAKPWLTPLVAWVRSLPVRERGLKPLQRPLQAF